jgi:hypothetical protein
MDDKKINEMNDLERRSKANSLGRDRSWSAKNRIGLQVNMGVILAGDAIPVRFGKWSWDE